MSGSAIWSKPPAKPSPSPRAAAATTWRTTNFSGSARQTYPAVPWSRAARTCDRLVHHYFDIDVDVLWSTITTDLAAMLEALGEGPATAVDEWERRVLDAPGAAERVSAIEEELRRAAGLPDGGGPDASP
jgi:hypothetical protein